MLKIAWLIGKSFSDWDCSVCECWGWGDPQIPTSFWEELDLKKSKKPQKSKLRNHLFQRPLKTYFVLLFRFMKVMSSNAILFGLILIERNEKPFIKKGLEILRGALGELDASPGSRSNCPSIPTFAGLPAHPPIHSFTPPAPTPHPSPFIPSGLSVFASSALCSHLVSSSLSIPYLLSPTVWFLCPHRSGLSCHQFVVALISPLLFLLLTVLLP